MLGEIMNETKDIPILMKEINQKLAKYMKAKISHDLTMTQAILMHHVYIKKKTKIMFQKIFIMGKII